MSRTSQSVALGVAMLALIGTSVALAAEKPGSTVAFEQLVASLVGEWKGVHEGTEITLTYTLTANNTALMEEFRPKKGPVMITMFSINGDRLV